MLADLTANTRYELAGGSVFVLSATPVGYVGLSGFGGCDASALPVGFAGVVGSGEFPALFSSEDGFVFVMMLSLTSSSPTALPVACRSATQGLCKHPTQGRQRTSRYCLL